MTTFDPQLEIDLLKKLTRQKKKHLSILDNAIKALPEKERNLFFGLDAAIDATEKKIKKNREPLVDIMKSSYTQNEDNTLSFNVGYGRKNKITVQKKVNNKNTIIKLIDDDFFVTGDIRSIKAHKQLHSFSLKRTR